MAMTPAEKQKRYRERQREKDAQASKATTTSEVFKRPFWEVWQDELQPYANDFDYYLDEAGVSAPGFDGDQGPEEFSAEAFPKATLHEIFPDLSHGSLRRAEFMAGSLKEAAETLATAVNLYKRSEIQARMAEIEASDLTQAEAKKAALQEAARLNKMLDQLDKQVRLTFPQWKVTG